jgi:hypothetical protein
MCRGRTRYTAFSLTLMARFTTQKLLSASCLRACAVLSARRPATTVGAILSNSLREKTSPYLRVARGEYTLKEKALAASNDQVEANTAENVEPATETGALRAFGMFWHRDLVFWAGTPPRLLGRQGAGATNVNFAAQIGVYLLHDRERVIYVGRAMDTLFARLKLTPRIALADVGIDSLGSAYAVSMPMANLPIIGFRGVRTWWSRQWRRC